MSNNAYLSLVLDGPLQSWGTSSRFDQRTTVAFPTKSAVIGIIAAAMGIDKNKPDEDDRIVKLAVRMTTISIPRNVRGRQLPMQSLEDFHTVGGGYDPKLQWKNMPRTADNKTRDNPVISYRQYLMDARFGVILEGDGELLQEVTTALANPVWGIWLGRKSCIPACPICLGVSATEADAWAKIRERLKLALSPIEQYDRVEETDPSNPNGLPVSDAPVAFGADIGRRHQTRRVAFHYKQT